MIDQHSVKKSILNISKILFTLKICKSKNKNSLVCKYFQESILYLLIDLIKNCCMKNKNKCINLRSKGKLSFLNFN